MRNKIFIQTVCLLMASSVFGQKNSFKIITQDVEHFWEAFDASKTSTDTTKVFQTLVLDRASDEFKVFIKKWNIKASHYTYYLRRFPEFYKTIRESAIRLINSKDSIRNNVAQLEKLYPNLNHADICIAFGNFRTGGNIAIEKDRNLIYIGLEFHGLDTNTDIKEFSSEIQDYVSRSNFFRTIIHEHIHIQHRTHGEKIAKTFNGNTLAHRVLSEGVPDFIAQLIVPDGNNGNNYDYGFGHEPELKEKLKHELFLTNYGDWFGGDGALFLNKPRDLGYFMGSRIGRNYYIANNLEGGNLNALIEVKSLKKFINESKYFDGL